MEENVKGTEIFYEKLAKMIDPNKKSNKVFYGLLFAIGFLIFDFFTSGLLVNEYIQFRIEWLNVNSRAVTATGVIGGMSLLSYAGFNLKGTIFKKYIPLLLKVFNFDSVADVEKVSNDFLQQQKTEAITKIKDRVSRNLKDLFDIEKKLNTPHFLTLDERDRLIDIAELFMTDLYNDGKEYILNYNNETPLKNIAENVGE